MTEGERLAKVKAALETAESRIQEAEGFLEDAATLIDEVTPEDTDDPKAEKIWQLRLQLDRLGIEILELSKT